MSDDILLWRTVGAAQVFTVIAKATVVCAIPLIVARAHRRVRASTRHVIDCAALGVLVLLPLTAGIMPAVTLDVPTASSESAPSVAVPVLVGESTATAPDAAKPYWPPWSGAGVWDAIVAIWAVGMLTILTPVAVGLRGLSGLRRRSAPQREGQRVCDELVAELGMRRRIRVLTSADGSGPLSFGMMTPVILLPRDLPAFGRGALQWALRHEIEHIRRLDWLTHTLAWIVCAAYWFHPLVWVTFRHLRLDAERACDDCVVQHEQSGVEYASLLVAVAERERPRYRPALAMAASSELGARVAAVLDNQQKRGPASRSTVLGAAAAALSIAVLLSSPIVIDARSTVGAPSAVVQEVPPATFEVASIRRNVDPNAQGKTAPFEVASIKRNTLAGVETTLRVDPGGRLTAVGAPLLWLIAGAYGNAAGALRYEQVVGAPSWLQDERYDITAQVADAAALGEGATFITMRPSLRALLDDRFKLKTHRESRQVPVYTLVRLGKGSGFGPGFSPSTVDCSKDQAKCAFRGGGPVGRIKADAITSDILMQLLANASGRIVVDRTGLDGPFTVDLEWSQDQSTSNKPSIFTAVQEQLGLKLESTRGPVDVLVIDHVERPTPD